MVILIAKMRFLRHKIKNIQRSFAALAAVAMFCIPALALAATQPPTKSTTSTKSTPATTTTTTQANVNQSYGVTGTVQQGMLVMLDPKNSKNVTPLSSTHDTALQGVVIAANESAVSLTGDGTSSQVYVATNGKYDVLVSTQNGPIKVGDILSISALDGVGMKADANESVILGKAVQTFDGTKGVSGTATLATSTGNLKVSIGLVQVDIGISHNPLAHSGTDSKVPEFLRKLAQAIAGKPVDAARIYIGCALLLVTIVIATSLLLGGVRSSLISVGRNPLAKNSVLRGMVQVLFVGIVVFILGLAAIYLLLKA